MTQNILFIDTETTGLIPKVDGKQINWRQNCHDMPGLASISWIYNSIEKDYIIKPQGWEIPEEAEAIHGISNAKAEAQGVPLIVVLLELINDGVHADNVVGHNLYFDTAILQANCVRIGGPIIELEEILHKSKRIDTMWKANSLMKLTQEGSKRRKFPNLGELHQYLFGEDIQDQHTSIADVMATKRCYAELVGRGVI